MRALSALLLVALAACGTDSSDRPNIVILIADDLGWNDVGAYGNRVVRTPNIDALASQGLKFNNAFLASASCSSSRASILTGKYPQTHGLLHLHQVLPAHQQTVARLLGQVGYFTVAVGKWHLGRPALDEFDDVVVDKSPSGALEWVAHVRNRPKDRPFFFWFAANDPHRPYADDEQDLGPAYAPDAIDLPPTFVEGPGGRRELAQYYAEVSRFDDYVGRVLDTLDDEGVLDNTIVIVMSDNGRPFHLAKMHLVDAGTKTPFVVGWRGKIRRAADVDALVSSVDLAPTLLAIAGAPIPAEIDGRSFANVLEDPTAEHRDYVFLSRNWHARNAHERAVRSKDFLYKQNQFPGYGDCHRSQYSTSPGFRELRSAYLAGDLDPSWDSCFAATRSSEELIDVRAPLPFTNLVDDPRYVDVSRRMSRVLRDWRARTADPDYEPYERPR